MVKVDKKGKPHAAAVQAAKIGKSKKTFIIVQQAGKPSVLFTQKEYNRAKKRAQKKANYK